MLAGADAEQLSETRVDGSILMMHDFDRCVNGCTACRDGISMIVLAVRDFHRCVTCMGELFEKRGPGLVL